MFGLSRKRLGTTLLMVAIISLLCSGIWQYTLYQRTFDIADESANTRMTIQAINQTLIALNRAGFAVYNYLLTNDDQSLAKIPELLIAADINFKALQQLIESDEIEVRIYKNVLPIYNEIIQHLESIVNAYKNGNKELATTLTIDIGKKKLLRQTSSMILDIKKIELGQLQSTDAAYEYNKILANKTVILMRMINIVLLVIAYVCIRRADDESDSNHGKR